MVTYAMPAHSNVPGGKRHINAPSEERDLKRIRQSVESHLRILLGLPVAPGITRPFPVHIDTVRTYFRKVAKEPPRDELDGRSQTEVDSTG